MTDPSPIPLFRSSRVQRNAGRISLLIYPLLSPVSYQSLKDNAILGAQKTMRCDTPPHLVMRFCLPDSERLEFFLHPRNPQQAQAEKQKGSRLRNCRQRFVEVNIIKNACLRMDTIYEKREDAWLAFSRLSRIS
jgi:hypothetical protein